MNRAEREIQRGKWVGIFLTCGVHVMVLGFLGIQGLKLIYPPPEEKGVLMEFVEDERIIEPIRDNGEEPRAENATPDAPVTLVQKSAAQTVAKTSKAAAPTTMDGEGDVEKYEQPREEPINQRALFSSANNKKTGEAPQTATEASDKLKAGNPQGNTEKGPVIGEATARLQGRDVVGKLPKPDYTENKEGTVVVAIVVDSQGFVTSATPGVKGTTTSSPTLWAAAKKAALSARFSPRTQDPAPQEGTIIYVFKLK